MAEPMYTIKIIQDSNIINPTILGVIIGSVITIFGNYAIEQLRIKAKRQEKNNEMLINLKEQITNILKETIDVDDSKIKITLYQQLTELMHHYQKINHISKVQRTELHIKFMTFHRELLEMIGQLDDNHPDNAIIGIIAYKTANIIDVINKYIK